MDMRCLEISVIGKCCLSIQNVFTCEPQYLYVQYTQHVIRTIYEVHKKIIIYFFFRYKIKSLVFDIKYVLIWNQQIIGMFFRILLIILTFFQVICSILILRNLVNTLKRPVPMDSKRNVVVCSFYKWLLQNPLKKYFFYLFQNLLCKKWSILD